MCRHAAAAWHECELSKVKVVTKCQSQYTQMHTGRVCHIAGVSVFMVREVTKSAQRMSLGPHTMEDMSMSSL